MNENHTILLAEIPIGEKGGVIWNRLHGEREEICETLVNFSGPDSDVYRELLQARLRKIDDALDHLMSGSYGKCSQCGRSINEIKLEVDPTSALCLDCSASNSQSVVPSSERVPTSTTNVLLETLNPFDTILLRTHNSDYRILLLDPRTGRALVEGGSYLPEPSEGLVKGSALPGSAFNGGAICTGGRLEMWVDQKVFLTSPIETVAVKHNATAESQESISAALH
jgi:hypothetical protein